MRLLAALLAGSGMAWIAGLLLTNPYLLVPVVSPAVVLAAGYVVVGVGVVLTVRRRRQLPSRLAALWALAILALGALLAPAGLSLPLVGAALAYGTVAYLAWVVPPLLVMTFVSEFRRPPGATGLPSSPLSPGSTPANPGGSSPRQ